SNLPKPFFMKKYLLYIIIFCILGFNFKSDNPPGWYSQFINFPGQNLAQVIFIDTLTGYGISDWVSDTCHVFKTTNGGDNWFSVRSGTGDTRSIQVFDKNTVIVGGANIIKTTDGGMNWTTIGSSFC